MRPRRIYSADMNDLQSTHVARQTAFAQCPAGPCASSTRGIGYLFLFVMLLNFAVAHGAVCSVQGPTEKGSARLCIKCSVVTSQGRKRTQYISMMGCSRVHCKGACVLLPVRHVTRRTQLSMECRRRREVARAARGDAGGGGGGGPGGGDRCGTRRHQLRPGPGLRTTEGALNAAIRAKRLVSLSTSVVSCNGLCVGGSLARRHVIMKPNHGEGLRSGGPRKTGTLDGWSDVEKQRNISASELIRHSRQD